MLSMKNKYIVCSRISEAKFTKISEVSLCKIFKRIRILMATECEKISKFSGEIGNYATDSNLDLLALRKEYKKC